MKLHYPVTARPNQSNNVSFEKPITSYHSSWIASSSLALGFAMTRKIWYTTLLLCCSLCLSACATLQLQPIQSSPKVEIGMHQWIRLPQPAQLGLHIRATQILTAQHDGHTYTTQVQVEVNAKHIILIALSGWGSEIFSVDYNGTRIRSKHLPIANATIGIRHTLTDFILTYAPSKLIRQLLQNTRIKLKLNPQERIFTLASKPIIKIHYQHADPWKGKVILTNLARHYTISILTLKQTLTY